MQGNFSIANRNKIVSVILLHGTMGCPLFRGFHCIKVYGEMFGTLELSVIVKVSSTVEGCPLSGVSLYDLHIHNIMCGSNKCYG